MAKRGKPIWKRALGALAGALAKLLIIVLKIIEWAATESTRVLAGLFLSLLNFAKRKFAGSLDERKRPKGSAQYADLLVLEAKEGSFSAFENYLLANKSTIGIVLGARGSGKSALGMRILENVRARSGRNVAAMGFQKESLPKWIHCIENLDEIRNGSFILVDEGGIVFSARRALSDANKILSELLLISRHKDISVLFISQNSANLDINALRQADYLLLRKSALLQKDFERKKIREVYLQAKGLFEKHGKDKQKITYVYSDEFSGLVANPLPTFWSEGASKGFGGFKLK
ncbi:MAG: zonular occludens toxin domain-containing protein [Candidatus Micrarchaeota archaeon]